MHSFIPLSFWLPLLVDYAHAIILPFETRTVTRQRLSTRSDATIGITNSHNTEYISNLTLGGVNVPVMLDTGSSDLWVAADIKDAKDTGKSATLSYAVGDASGDIYTADMEFAGYSVSDQAFLLVTDTSSFSTDIESQGYQGLIGLGPNTGSTIADKLSGGAGDNALNRIFQENGTSSNYISFMLSRLGDQGSNVTGQFTISEPVSGYENITSMPKISVMSVSKLTDQDQHWQIYTDVDGLVGPDGEPVKYDSIVPKAPDGRMVAVLDSGFTLPQVPREVADAIYGRVQGASWDNTNQLWTIPCDQYLNITLMFAGVAYPIHPLDTSSSDFGLTGSDGQSVCVGTFQPITSAFSLLGEYDMILGMSFLRNTYTLLDYGDFVDNTANDKQDPFVQMLPMTNSAAAKQDFIQVRLNGQDTTGDSSKALLPADQGQTSPESASEKKKEREEKILSRWPYILLGCLVFVALLIGLIVWRCCCRRGKKGKKGLVGKKRQPSESMLPMGAKSYLPLSDPAPPMHLQNMSSERVHQDPYATMRSQGSSSSRTHR